MKGTTLRALGLNLDDMDARVLLDEGFNCREYGLSKPGTRKLALLRTFINEYREDLSKNPGKVIRSQPVRPPSVGKPSSGEIRHQVHGLPEESAGSA